MIGGHAVLTDFRGLDLKAGLPERRSAPRVSVVIPNYNHTQYLRGALRSALSQSHPAFEVIVVDDGSTDNCRDVVGEFGDDVRYIRQTNQGLAGARNTGIVAARGELIGLLDADDQWMPTFVASMLSLVARNPGASVYYSSACAVDGAGRRLPQVFGGPPVRPDRLYDRLLRANFLIPSTILVRRDAVLDAGLFDTSFKAAQGCEDWDLWLRLLPKHSFVGTGECLAMYRIHGDSMSARSTGMQRSALMVMEKRFGPDDGSWETWPRHKRLGYGGGYRYLALTSIQRQQDWKVAADYLRRALRVDPGLAKDLGLFYELALGSQPAGHRGTADGLTLTENARRLKALVAAVFEGERRSTLGRLRRMARGTSWHALGLVAYNTGAYPESWRFLSRALYYRPELWRNRVVIGDLLKSFVRRPRRDHT